MVLETGRAKEGKNITSGFFGWGGLDRDGETKRRDVHSEWGSIFAKMLITLDVGLGYEGK